jgi:release factor glutamine methyltransferase
VENRDLESLVRDKYNGDRKQVTASDLERLAKGEPLAYVIGWIPFLGLRIELDTPGTRPLIPRVETEWWTEKLVQHLLLAENSRTPLRVLDLCAGSGAIGLSILKHVPEVKVFFGEISSDHAALIEHNLGANHLDVSRAVIRTGDLFEPFSGERFSVIAVNPPYIPDGRVLPESVMGYEPGEALFSGADGLEHIRRIAEEAPSHLLSGGELWLECDTEHAEDAEKLLASGGALGTELLTDQYGRKRVVLAYY